MMQVTCPNCKSTIEVNGEQAQVQCPLCGNTIVVANAGVPSNKPLIHLKQDNPPVMPMPGIMRQQAPLPPPKPRRIWIVILIVGFIVVFGITGCVFAVTKVVTALKNDIDVSKVEKEAIAPLQQILDDPEYKKNYYYAYCGDWKVQRLELEHSGTRRYEGKMELKLDDSTSIFRTIVVTYEKKSLFDFPRYSFDLNQGDLSSKPDVLRQEMLFAAIGKLDEKQLLEFWEFDDDEEIRIISAKHPKYTCSVPIVYTEPNTKKKFTSRTRMEVEIVPISYGRHVYDVRFFNTDHYLLHNMFACEMLHKFNELKNGSKIVGCYLAKKCTNGSIDTFELLIEKPKKKYSNSETEKKTLQLQVQFFDDLKYEILVDKGSNSNNRKYDYKRYSR